MNCKRLSSAASPVHLQCSNRGHGGSNQQVHTDIGDLSCDGITRHQVEASQQVCLLAQGGYKVYKAPKRSPKIKTTHPDCVRSKFPPKSSEEQTGWRKFHSTAARVEEETSGHTSYMQILPPQSQFWQRRPALGGDATSSVASKSGKFPHCRAWDGQCPFVGLPSDYLCLRACYKALT